MSIFTILNAFKKNNIYIKTYIALYRDKNVMASYFVNFPLLAWPSAMTIILNLVIWRHISS